MGPTLCKGGRWCEGRVEKLSYDADPTTASADPRGALEPEWLSSGLYQTGENILQTGMKCQAFTPVQSSVTWKGTDCLGGGACHWQGGSLQARRRMASKVLRALCKWGNRGTKEQALGLSACSLISFSCLLSCLHRRRGWTFSVLMGSGARTSAQLPRPTSYS